MTVARCILKITNLSEFGDSWLMRLGAVGISFTESGKKSSEILLILKTIVPG